MSGISRIDLEPAVLEGGGERKEQYYTVNDRVFSVRECMFPSTSYFFVCTSIV